MPSSRSKACDVDCADTPELSTWPLVCKQQANSAYSAARDQTSSDIGAPYLKARTSLLIRMYTNSDRSSSTYAQHEQKLPWNLKLPTQKWAGPQWQSWLDHTEFETIPKNVCVGNNCAQNIASCDGILREKLSLDFSMVQTLKPNKNLCLLQINDTAQKLVPVYKLQPIQLHVLCRYEIQGCWAGGIQCVMHVMTTKFDITCFV